MVFYSCSSIDLATNFQVNILNVLNNAASVHQQKRWNFYTQFHKSGMDQVFFKSLQFFSLCRSATRRENDRNMWRANSYFLRGNIFFLLLRLRNSFFCFFFFIQSQAFESFECSSFCYCNNLVKPWNYVIASSSYVFLRHSYDYHLALFWASSITHKKKRSREFSLRKKPTLRQNHIL